MRVVLDTNIVISGLFWSGPPRRILDFARAEIIQLYTSPALLGELEDVLGRPKFVTRLAIAAIDVRTLMSGYMALARAVHAQPIPPICRDPSDDEVLSCARAAQAELIVSGDSDLLALYDYQGVPIRSGAEACVFIETSGSP